MNKKLDAWIEETLPYFLVMGQHFKLTKLGFPQTPGVVAHFRDNVLTRLNGLPVVENQARRRILTDTANAMTAELRPDDPRDFLLTCLAFPPLLVENGLWGTEDEPDPTAALCLQEIRDYAVLGQWKINDTWVTDTAKRMLQRARIMGYYS